MKKIIFILTSFACAGPLLAQDPTDALRYSWNVSSGTARQQAVGGAMASLGGDLSAAYVNPAGLGFYKTGDFVLSPGSVSYTHLDVYKRQGLDWTTKSGWIGTGQTVVIIDSGVERNHPYLAGRVIYEACFSTNTDGSGGCPNGQRSQTNVTGSAAPCTYSWGCAHGTHVAHIAAGQYGVAPGARIIAIRASHKEWSTKTLSLIHI